jgi:hypothetical protein
VPKPAVISLFSSAKIGERVLAIREIPNVAPGDSPDLA